MSLRPLNLRRLRLSFINETIILGSIRKSSTTSEARPTLTEYPPILDLSPEEVYKRNRNEKLDKIKKLGTVEEKLIGINMPRYYGWSSVMLKEGTYPFDFMPFVQHITRTDFLEIEKYPFSHKYSQSDIERLTEKIRPQLQDAIIMELLKKRHLYEFDGSKDKMGDNEISDEITKGVVEQVNRVLCSNLASVAPHLLDTEIDFEPRIEAFWRVGGFYPDNETYKKRVKDKEDYEKEVKKNLHAKRTNEEEPEDLVGHFVQYIGNPVLQLRHAKPSKPLAPQFVPQTTTEGKIEEPRVPDLKHVPDIRYDPGFYGLEKIRRHGTNIPGFWPGDRSEFGLLSFHSRGHLLGRPPSFGERDVEHTVNAQALLAGYGWLLAQAAYQGRVYTPGKVYVKVRSFNYHRRSTPEAIKTIIKHGYNFNVAYR